MSGYPEILHRIWAKGMDVHVRDRGLEVTGGADLDRQVRDSLLKELDACQDEVFSFLKADAYASLLHLAKTQGLRFRQGRRGIVPVYPRDFTPFDRDYVQDLFVQASPLLWREAQTLLAAQGREVAG